MSHFQNEVTKKTQKWLDGVSEDTEGHHLKGTRTKLKLLKLLA